MNNPIFKSEAEIKLHVCALKRLAYADGVFCDREKAFINSTISAYCTLFPNLSSRKLLDDDYSESDFKQALARLKVLPIQARLLIKDLIALGHADDDYCENERKTVAGIAETLEIPQSVVERLEKAVAEMLAAVRAVNRIITESTTGGEIPIRGRA